MDPVFLLILPLDGELTFYLKMIHCLENDLESSLIFVLFLKGKQNKKETLNVTLYLEKRVRKKLSLGPRVGLPIGNVQ